MCRKASGHCVIRRCLGIDRGDAPSTLAPGFSLRDLKLSRAQLTAAGVDPVAVAENMGETLAFLLWYMGIDGKGVDYVLAPDRAPIRGAERPSRGSTFSSAVLGEHVAVWMLDFEECRAVAADDVGVDRAVRTFLGSGRGGRPASVLPDAVSERQDGR
jgi:hypothetical protein